MKEIRCKKCNKLLARISEKTENTMKDVEIKCPRCKELNKF